MGIKFLVDEINKSLAGLFQCWAGSKLYGLAHTVYTRNGQVVKLRPVILTDDGEGLDLTFDDTYPITLYHQCNSINSSLDTSVARGDSQGLIVNIYNNSMTIFNNRPHTKLLPDELYLYVQSNFPEKLFIKPFSRVLVKFTNVVLNTQANYAAQYQNPEAKVIPPHVNLFVINYTVEAAFKKNCFDACPC